MKTPQMDDDVVMVDDVVFTPLTNKIITNRPVAKNVDMFSILNKDFRASRLTHSAPLCT